MKYLYCVVAAIYMASRAMADEHGDHEGHDHDDEESELLSLFVANTGLAKWWDFPDYTKVAEGQIEALKSSDYDFLCLSELATQKVIDQFVNGLKDKYPYSYVPERDNSISTTCKCTSQQFEVIEDCLEPLQAEYDADNDGDVEFGECFLKAGKDGNQSMVSVQCSGCWTAYYDESVGMESIADCDGGEFEQSVDPIGKPPVDHEPTCLYGDGQMNMLMLSKYEMSETADKKFTKQSAMYNGITTAKVTKDDINYQVFCTGYASYRHWAAMKVHGDETVQFMKDQKAFDQEDETIVLLAGDFNSGKKGECELCVDYPTSDDEDGPSLAVYDKIANQADMYSIYENNFKEGDNMKPMCTGCSANWRNYDGDAYDEEYDNYIGLNIFTINKGSNVINGYMAKREWLAIDEDINTTLADKYPVGIMQKSEEFELAFDSNSGNMYQSVIAIMSVILMIFTAY